MQTDEDLWRCGKSPQLAVVTPETLGFLVCGFSCSPPNAPCHVISLDQTHKCTTKLAEFPRSYIFECMFMLVLIFCDFLLEHTSDMLRARVEWGLDSVVLLIDRSKSSLISRNHSQFVP